MTIPRRFAVGRYAVTFEEWDFAVAAGGCGGYRPDDEGWGRGRLPVINVSWDDAQAYVAWLNSRTVKIYRLPSEAEWEYCCRAETNTPFWWGDEITPDQANYSGIYIDVRSLYRGRTLPVDSFAANPWGLFQVHGNVWEWVEDGWHESYADMPKALKAHGGKWTTEASDAHVLRGGSWVYGPYWLRSSSRYGLPAGFRSFEGGFRLARTLF